MVRELERGAENQKKFREYLPGDIRRQENAGKWDLGKQDVEKMELC